MSTSVASNLTRVNTVNLRHPAPALACFQYREVRLVISLTLAGQTPDIQISSPPPEMTVSCHVSALNHVSSSSSNPDQLLLRTPPTFNGMPQALWPLS